MMAGSAPLFDLTCIQDSPRRVCNLRVHEHETISDIIKRVADALDIKSDLVLLYDLEVLWPLHTLEQYGIVEPCYLDILPRGMSRWALPPQFVLTCIKNEDRTVEYFLHVRKYDTRSKVTSKLRALVVVDVVLQHPDGTIVSPDQTLEDSGVIEPCTFLFSVSAVP